MTPPISVVIPAFNADRFLWDALDSVGQQTIPPLDCIVVDDGSTDRTKVIAGDHPSCTGCVSQANRGVSAARNTGAAHARGELLAFLDADDAWLPRRLELMAARMIRDRSDAVLCGSWIAEASLEPLAPMPLPSSLTPAQMLLGDATLWSSSNLLISREAFLAVGGFDESISCSADWDLSFRIVDRLRWSFETEPLVLYRQHSGSMKTDVDLMATEMRYIYDRIFASADSERSVLRRPALGALHRMLAGSYFVNGRPSAFVAHAVKSVYFAPGEARYLVSALARRLRRGAARTATPLA